MAQAGAVAQDVYTQGSCLRQGVSMDTDSGCDRAETGVQAESLTAALVNQSCSAQSWCEQGTVARKAQPTVAMNRRQGRL